jgi:hypothetical protein
MGLELECIYIAWKLGGETTLGQDEVREDNGGAFFRSENVPKLPCAVVPNQDPLSDTRAMAGNRGLYPILAFLNRN